MKIQNQVYFVVVVMILGKACGYSEEAIIDLVKFIIGFGIIINAKFVIKTVKGIKEYALKVFTKN